MLHLTAARYVRASLFSIISGKQKKKRNIDAEIRFTNDPKISSLDGNL